MTSVFFGFLIGSKIKITTSLIAAKGHFEQIREASQKAARLLKICGKITLVLAVA